MKKRIKKLLILIAVTVLAVIFCQSALAAGSKSTVSRIETPSIETVRNATDGIKVIWSEAKGAKGYLVYRRDSTSKQWQRITKTDASTLSFTDKKVKSTESYTYMVKGYSAGAVSQQSNTKKWNFLPTPQITEIKPYKTCIGISWSKVSKAVNYQIFRKSPADSDFTLYKTVAADTLEFFDKGVKDGVKYGYIVRAVDKNKIASGHYAASYCTFTGLAKITQVTNASDGVHLNWKKVSQAQSYNVYRKYDGGSWEKIQSTKNTFFTDKAAKAGKKCVYTVRAVCNGIQGDYEKQGTPSCYLTPPASVKLVSAAKSNKLTWNKSNGATNYNIYRKSEKDSDWTRIARVTGNSYTDSDIKSGTTYKYYIRAYVKTDFKSAASTVIASNGIDASKKLVALTYDDGPSTTITNRVLDTLEKYNSRATFFILGSRITAHYEALQRAVKLNCEIGNHTYNHVNLPSADEADIKREITETDKLVKKHTGVTPKIARAPGGSTSEYSSKLVGKPFIYWSIDTRDWESRDAASIVSIVKSEVRDGSIILMHDLYEATAQASEYIIPWLIKEGYQLVTVSELMQYRGIKMQNGVTYYNAYK